MKKLTSAILALVFTATIALAIINSTFATVKTENVAKYATVFACGLPGGGPPPKAK